MHNLTPYYIASESQTQSSLLKYAFILCLRGTVWDKIDLDPSRIMDQRPDDASGNIDCAKRHVATGVIYFLSTADMILQA